MKIWNKIKTYVVLLTIALILGWAIIGTSTARHQKSQIKSQNEQIMFQQRTIDSLLNLPRNGTEIYLQVSDNSKTTLNAKKQSGEIIFPNNKIYELRIDSLSIKKTTKHQF